MTTFGEEIADLKERSLYRRVRRLETATGPWVMLEGRKVLIFGSNNYLGLATHDEVRRAAAMAAMEWGTGAGGSRLAGGNLEIHEALEDELAAFKGTDDALVFSSGYLAALGAITALAGKDDLILSDSLNHGSLIDGCRLSGATIRIYHHSDADHLADLMLERSQYRRCLVVTDGVFSMDGDVAPLHALYEVCRENDATLFVDDAHGTGVIGPNGAGSVAHCGIDHEGVVQMGTLSKALGAQGGFIAADADTIDLIRNRGRSFLFDTALAPASVAAARKALELIQSEPQRRAQLQENSRFLRALMSRRGVAIPGDYSSPILPVLVGDSEEAMALSRDLEAAGIWVPAIRPPTVPAGTSRLRVTVLASHEMADLYLLDNALAELTE